MSPRLWWGRGGGGGGKLIIVGLLFKTTCTYLLQYTFHPLSQTSLCNQIACGHFYSLIGEGGGGVCMLGRCVLGGEVASLCGGR